MPTDSRTDSNPEDQWEAWGEEFGKRMEAWARGFEKQMDKKIVIDASYSKKQFSVGGLVFSLFFLAWGFTELGNQLGWWETSFPFWPAILIIVGFAILISVLRRH